MTFTSGTAAGTSHDVIVYIIDDEWVESPETFHLSISNVTSSDSVSVESPNAVTVTITDTDSK